jgi:hypothetical protein
MQVRQAAKGFSFGLEHKLVIKTPFRLAASRITVPSGAVMGSPFRVKLIVFLTTVLITAMGSLVSLTIKGYSF